MATLNTNYQLLCDATTSRHSCEYSRDCVKHGLRAEFTAPKYALHGIRLYGHVAQQDKLLTAEKLHALHAGAKRVEIWFCGQ